MNKFSGFLVAVFVILNSANCGTMEAISKEGGVRPFGGTRFHLDSKNHSYQSTTAIGPCIRGITLIDLPVSLALDLVLLPYAIISPAKERKPVSRVAPGETYVMTFKSYKGMYRSRGTGPDGLGGYDVAVGVKFIKPQTIEFIYLPDRRYNANWGGPVSIFQRREYVQYKRTIPVKVSRTAPGSYDYFFTFTDGQRNCRIDKLIIDRANPRRYGDYDRVRGFTLTCKSRFDHNQPARVFRMDKWHEDPLQDLKEE